MDNEKGHNRPGHDGLFKLFLREPDTARDFLAVHLPADIRAQVRLDTLKLEPGSFVDQKLRELHSDVLYSVETAEGHAGYIYCLVEHQSTADRMMAWRMMRYSMAVMDAHLKKGNDTLPVVVPLLFYQGTVRPYPYSTDWMDCFDVPALAREVYSRPWPLVDVSVMEDSDLQSHRRMALLELVQRDTPSVLNSIAAYVEQQNRQMNRQVRLNVQVLSVSTSRKEQLGLDWNIVYKSLRSAGASLNNVSGDIANATSASVSILDSATGNAAKFAGSSLLIKALSEQGDVSVVTSQGSVTTNLTPVPIQMADQTVYVAQSSTTTTTDVGATTSLTPGMMTTGFNMTLLPLIQDDGDVQLQVAFNLSDPPTIRNFTSKDGNSYIEMPYTKLRSLSQKTNLRAGQALVLTGFDQSNTRMTKNGTFTPGNFLLGGGRDGDDSRSTLVIIITPELMGNGG
ncbi:PilN family type IVB pilus formation outer membrane protein [Salmonella enterica]|nr:PilN family type IVB pilus formation outer membrane protein [Salmonella enterica]